MVACGSPEERLQLVERLASCSSFPLVADRLLEPLAAALQASSSVFVEFAERPGQGVGVGKRSYVGARPWSVEAYAERYFRVDPLVVGPELRLLRIANDDAMARVAALPAIGGWRDSDYYRRFLLPSDITHVLGITVPFRSTLGRQLLCLGFHRRHAEAPFGPAESALLRQMSPVVGSVLSGMAAREALSISGVLCERLVGTHPSRGFLVLDEDLMVLHAGGSAMEDLGLRASRDSERGRPGGSLLGELRQRLLAAAPMPGAPAIRFTLARPGAATALEIDIETVVTDSGARHIVTTSIGGDRQAADACRRLGLTARETEVARLVCTGSSNTEIGRVLGISLRTVENHLRSIYAKAQVSSRTQLAAQVLS